MTDHASKLHKAIIHKERETAGAVLYLQHKQSTEAQNGKPLGQQQEDRGSYEWPFNIVGHRELPTESSVVEHI